MRVESDRRGEEGRPLRKVSRSLFMPIMTIGGDPSYGECTLTYKLNCSGRTWGQKIETLHEISLCLNFGN